MLGIVVLFSYGSISEQKMFSIIGFVGCFKIKEVIHGTEEPISIPTTATAGSSKTISIQHKNITLTISIGITQRY